MASCSPNASHGLVGASRPIAKVRELIERLGRRTTQVLLLGESGTGKEVVAKAIHEVTASGPFVPIDCGSLVGPLMESELFGHTKGAFTGAGEAKRGLIESANGGTAFFDEIGDLPLDLQVKLLRLLQEREYRPVGSVVRHKVKLRVIAATHRDLAAEVSRGSFREDLFYRLNVVAVRLPPLRERKEDIPLLIEHFLKRLDRDYAISQDAINAMMAYHWPGNVRELEHSIERMVAVNSGPILHSGDLPSSLQNFLEAADAPPRAMAAAAGLGSISGAVAPPTPACPIRPMEEVIQKAIQQAIEYTKGDRGMAAHLLGIGRTTLYRKLKGYNCGVEDRIRRHL